jgi:hypothetical protein
MKEDCFYVLLFFLWMEIFTRNKALFSVLSKHLYAFFTHTLCLSHRLSIHPSVFYHEYWFLAVSSRFFDAWTNFRMLTSPQPTYATFTDMSRVYRIIHFISPKHFTPMYTKTPPQSHIPVYVSDVSNVLVFCFLSFRDRLPLFLATASGSVQSTREWGMFPP